MTSIKDNLIASLEAARESLASLDIDPNLALTRTYRSHNLLGASNTLGYLLEHLHGANGGVDTVDTEAVEWFRQNNPFPHLPPDTQEAYLHSARLSIGRIAKGEGKRHDVVISNFYINSLLGGD
jgi:hypothetical protein